MKNQPQLNEKDAILDMLESEKQLMSLYATALFEGSAKSIRKEFSTNFTQVAANQYTLFNQLSTRGYYTPATAPKQQLDMATDSFKKQQKQLKAQ